MVDQTNRIDDLALPVDFEAKYGAGQRRALVLGGGGVVAVTWQIAYLDELANLGLDLRFADLLVGTSAGSIVCSCLAGGRLSTAAKAITLFSKAPSLVSVMAPTNDFKPSQTRAVKMFRESAESDPATVREIGRAAMAAATPSMSHLPRALFAMLRSRSWGSRGLRIVTTDAYSGERVVLTGRSGVAVNRAAAASASVPGIFAPQQIADRKCVDGGVCGSATHSDIVAGADRVLVLPLADGVPEPGMFCQRPDSLRLELDQLRASGSAVELRVPELSVLGDVGTASLMDPGHIPVAMQAARAQAARDVPGLREFWLA